MVTSGSVPTGITYRTNNVSNLEEKNIWLFISLVESELKIKNVFGKSKETVFRKYIDFFTVIDGLAKIPKKTASKSGIKSFEKKLREKLTPCMNLKVISTTYMMIMKEQRKLSTMKNYMIYI